MIEATQAGCRQISLHSRPLHPVGNVRQNPDIHAEAPELSEDGERLRVRGYATLGAGEERVGDHLAIAGWEPERRTSEKITRSGTSRTRGFSRVL